jgi:hypothetical protein
MIFMHLPKTGGTYTRAIINSLALNHSDILHVHCRFNDIPKDIIDGMPDGMLVWGLVRHPLTWYQSRWAHRCAHGWFPEHEFDYKCVSNDFNKFVNNCLDFYPTGWLAQEYANFFAGIPHRFKQYIGRYEELDNSIKHALIESGTLYCESEYPEIMPVNVSMLDGLSSSEIAVYNEDTFNRVLDVERTVIDRFYSGLIPTFNTDDI